MSTRNLKLSRGFLGSFLFFPNFFTRALNSEIVLLIKPVDTRETERATRKSQWHSLPDSRVSVKVLMLYLETNQLPVIGCPSRVSDYAVLCFIFRDQGSGSQISAFPARTHARSRTL